MQSVIPVYKPLGLTPLEAVNLFKQQNRSYADATISYAGRLDPMAEGLLLLLVNDENKKRQQFEAMPKTYEFSVLLGVSTDTYDILGKVVNLQSYVLHHLMIENGDLRMEIQKLLDTFIGAKFQSYPPYSSKAVQGKPLYWWARNNKLDEIVIPQKEIEIYSLALIRQETLAISDVRLTISEKVKLVHGDFRQTEILQTWETFLSRILDTQPALTFPILTCRVVCSSGTYVRGIANELGTLLGCGAIAYSINRTCIGEYTLDQATSITAPPRAPVQELG